MQRLRFKIQRTFQELAPPIGTFEEFKLKTGPRPIGKLPETVVREISHKTFPS